MEITDQVSHLVGDFVLLLGCVDCDEVVYRTLQLKIFLTSTFNRG
jgi:hypothetical protein